MISTIQGVQRCPFQTWYQRSYARLLNYKHSYHSTFPCSHFHNVNIVTPFLYSSYFHPPRHKVSCCGHGQAIQCSSYFLMRSHCSKLGSTNPRAQRTCLSLGCCFSSILFCFQLRFFMIGFQPFHKFSILGEK